MPMTTAGLKAVLLSEIVRDVNNPQTQDQAMEHLAKAIVEYIQGNALVSLDPVAFSATAPAGGGPVVLTSATGSVS